MSSNTSELLSADHLTQSVIAQPLEMDERLIETVDYIDPVKLAQILAMAQEEES